MLLADGSAMQVFFRPPFRLLCAMLSAWFCFGCAATSPALQRFEYIDFVMATRARVVLYAHDEGEARQAGRAAIERMHELEAVMSDYRETSELSRLMAAPFAQPFAISNDLFRVLSQSQRLAQLSCGAFDATIGPFSLLWRQVRRDGRLPIEDELAEARRRVGWRLLVLDDAAQTATLLVEGMRLDLGGIGKGFAVDEAMHELRRRGYAHVLVSLAGDLAVGEPPPGREAWVIAIRAGAGASERSLRLRNQAVSTSGDLEQFVEFEGLRYSHILDPRTGMGLVRHLAVTVIAADATTADGLATALNALGPDGATDLLSHFPEATAIFLEE